MSRRLSDEVRAIRAGLRPALARALNGLVGCPVGGWGETAQAMRRIADESPRLAEREWSVDDLVSRVLVPDYADRYRWRDEANALRAVASVAS